LLTREPTCDSTFNGHPSAGAGVDINTIRAWLGHVSLETTNRYAEADLEMKAKALATCAITEPGRTPHSKSTWRDDRDLMNFLTSL
jgi:hypothetical protein